MIFQIARLEASIPDPHRHKIGFKRICCTLSGCCRWPGLLDGNLMHDEKNANKGTRIIPVSGRLSQNTSHSEQPIKREHIDR